MSCTIQLDNLPLMLFIGYERENDARGFAFDFSSWAKEYGEGVLQLLIRRPGDKNPYPVVMSVEGSVATWLPSATDTAVEGTGKVQLIYTVGSVIAKTAIMSVLISPSIGTGTTPPEGFEVWLEQLTDLAAKTQKNASDAASSAGAASDSADKANDAKTTTLAAQESAKTDALISEGYAVGEQYGEAVGAGSPYFENNARFYSEVALEAASEGGWVHFYIDSEGYLHYVKTPNAELAFYLQDGNLYVRT